MKLSLYLLIAILTTSVAISQTVVVSEYMSQAGGLSLVDKEWTELLVIADNVRLVNYFLTDYGSSISARSSGPQFLDVPLWRNVRAGTIILIRHGTTNEVPNFDTNAADGYIELSQYDARFFRIERFDSSDATGLNIAIDVDYVEILDPDTVHVHGLAHCRSSHSLFTNSPGPKAAYDTNSIGDAASVRVSGRSLAAYAAGLGRDSCSRGRYLGEPSEGPSAGLPNLIDNQQRLRGFRNKNQLFWREVREPEWTTAPTITLVNQQADKHVISWTPVADGNGADGVTGYVILRDTLGFAQFPAGVIRDGAMVSAGQRIGTSVVLALQQTKFGASYTDQLNLACGTTYTYRVYGYRFDADHVMTIAQTYDSTARGRQYNETFAQSTPVTKPNPAKPTISASRISICPGDTTTLSTTTTDATLYEWTVDGRPVPVGGTTRVVVREAGTYKLKITAQGGCFAESDPITISFLPAQIVNISPSGAQTICPGDSVVFSSLVVGTSYEWLRDGVPIPGATSQKFVAKQTGEYQVRLAVQQGCPGISPVVRVRLLDVRYYFEPASIDFGTLGACETSTSEVVELVNDGIEAITIGSVAVPSGFALAFPPPGFVVAPGARQNVRMLFAPSSNGVATGNAVFTAQPCDTKNSLSLRGERVGGSASLSSAGIDFGVYTACPGTDIRPDTSFFITNEGTSPITVRAPLVSPPFYLLTQFTLRILLPAEQFQIGVQYRPLGADLNRGVTQEIAFPFTSTTCSDTLRASLQAASYQPSLSTSFTNINIGSVLSCYGTADTVVDVTNSSPLEATLTSSINGAIVVVDAPVLIPPASTRSVRIRVTPGGSGFFIVNDTLIAQACDVQLPLTVRGTFIDPSYAALPSTTIVEPVHFCSGDSTSTGQFTLTATGAGGLRSTIASVEVSAPFSTSLNVGQTLFDSINVTVMYSPTSVSFDVDTIVIVIAPCLDTVKCIVTGVANSSSRSTSITSEDFGTIGPLQSSSRVITITNTGSEDMIVEAIDGISAPFRIESSVPVLPATIAPTENAVVRIAYDFTEHDRHDTINIQSRTSTPCPDTVRFTLTASTTPSDTLITSLTMVVPTTLTARIGESVSIPFALLAPSSIAASNVTSMGVYVRYDPTIMLPIGITSPFSSLTGSVAETRPGFAHISISSSQPVDAADPLFSVIANTYMGAARVTLIEIDSVVIAGFDPEVRDGQLTLVGECAIETQVISLGRMPTLSIESASNSNVTLSFTTLTDDETTITVSDIIGNRYTNASFHVRPGTHSYHLPVSHLGPGIYNISMTHGRYVRSLPVLILR